jgi:hypothetical protein
VTVLRVGLNEPQARFLELPHKFRAFVGGFGSGKTWVGCAALAAHFYSFPRINAGYFAPTYPQIRDIFYPTVEEALLEWGLTTAISVGNHEVQVFRGRTYLGTVKCRSMDNPSSIVGFKIGRALVDEVDVMPAEKAGLAWRKIIARMRYSAPGLPNAIDVTTTPEGFRFTYEQFVKLPRERPERAAMYGIVQASTYDNEIHLPADYIPSLLESYPAQAVEAYINGQFVNLTAGTVYGSYDRKLNGCQDSLLPGEPAFVGMDFNVGKMAAIIHAKRDGWPRAVDEIVNGYDTPSMIRSLKARLWEWDQRGNDFRRCRQVRVYPDASGESRRSVNASASDLALLREAGFVVCAPRSNPPVRDRVNAMNGLFCNAQGERRYLVNADRCPTYAEALEQQAWASNGEPDKSSGFDHAVDAGGYFVHFDYPVVRRVTSIQHISTR